MSFTDTFLFMNFNWLWLWLIQGDSISPNQAAGPLRSIFFLLLNLTTNDINHTTASVFWWGLTSCLVLFWYLSLRNSCRYSDPCVWRGTVKDEVRLLTAMKQYLKRIKRHFPWLDLCRFKLTQALHLTTESWSEHKRCANALLLVFRRSAKSSPFRLLSNCGAGWRFFRNCRVFFHCSWVERDIRMGQTLLVCGVGCVRTCSGFSVNLVNLSRTSNSTEFFNQTFSHPFTPSWKPAAMLITHNYWDLSVAKQRHFCLLSCRCCNFTFKWVSSQHISNVQLSAENVTSSLLCWSEVDPSVFSRIHVSLNMVAPLIIWPLLLRELSR